jgi:hypothetical protein
VTYAKLVINESATRSEQRNPVHSLGPHIHPLKVGVAPRIEREGLDLVGDVSEVKIERRAVEVRCKLIQHIAISLLYRRQYR